MSQLDLLTGTEPCLVAEVPGAGNRWRQVHFNLDIARQFFSLTPGDNRSITLEKVGSLGELVARTSRQLVFPDANRNARLEFDWGSVRGYPTAGRPILVVVDSEFHTYRYVTLLPGASGYDNMSRLLDSRPSIGRGVRRTIVPLDVVEASWPGSPLRGSI